MGVPRQHVGMPFQDVEGLLIARKCPFRVWEPFQSVGFPFQSVGVPCQDMGVPFKGMVIPNQVVKVPIQGLGVSF